MSWIRGQSLICLVISLTSTYAQVGKLYLLIHQLQRNGLECDSQFIEKKHR